MNNPYMNSFYGAYPQSQQPYTVQQVNPYMERLQNLQQFQQNLQQPQQMQQNYLNGKVVDSIDVVKATDIPMDGNLYYFPKADGTEIYAKNWMPNGTTRILTFKPVLENDGNYLPADSEKSKFEAISGFVSEFMKRFDNLDKRLDDMEQSWTKSWTKNTKSSTKKENDLE